MKKCIGIGLVCAPVLLIGMETGSKTKTEEAVSKMIVVAQKKRAELDKNRSISGSGEFILEKKEDPIAQFIKSSGSSYEQGCSPSLRDYYGI